MAPASSLWTHVHHYTDRDPATAAPASRDRPMAAVERRAAARVPGAQHRGARRVRLPGALRARSRQRVGRTDMALTEAAAPTKAYEDPEIEPTRRWMDGARFAETARLYSPRQVV